MHIVFLDAVIEDMDYPLEGNTMIKINSNHTEFSKPQKKDVYHTSRLIVLEQ